MFMRTGTKPLWLLSCRASKRRMSKFRSREALLPFPVRERRRLLKKVRAGSDGSVFKANSVVPSSSPSVSSREKSRHPCATGFCRFVCRARRVISRVRLKLKLNREGELEDDRFKTGNKNRNWNRSAGAAAGLFAGDRYHRNAGRDHFAGGRSRSERK